MHHQDGLVALRTGIKFSVNSLVLFDPVTCPSKTKFDSVTLLHGGYLMIAFFWRFQR